MGRIFSKTLKGYHSIKEDSHNMSFSVHQVSHIPRPVMLLIVSYAFSDE